MLGVGVADVDEDVEVVDDFGVAVLVLVGFGEGELVVGGFVEVEVLVELDDLVDEVEVMVDLIVLVVVLQVGFNFLLVQDAELVIDIVEVCLAELEMLVQLHEVIVVSLVDVVTTTAGTA